MINGEKRQEIIKSLAFGFKIQDIASFEDVTAEDIEEISKDCADEITEYSEFLKLKGGERE